MAPRNLFWASSGTPIASPESPMVPLAVWSYYRVLLLQHAVPNMQIRCERDLISSQQVTSPHAKSPTAIAL